MIIWLWQQIFSSAFGCDKFNISLFFHVFHRFSKTAWNINFKKIFFKITFCFFLRSVFMSIYDFNQVFCQNLTIICKFFKNNPSFNAYFKFLMCITYSVLPWKLATSYLTFLIFMYSGKKLNIEACRKSGTQDL